MKFETLEVKISSKVYLKYISYLKYRSILSIAQFQLEKILVEVYKIYGALARATNQISQVQKHRVKQISCLI